ncbi:restriction endonuclease [Mycobacterium montefiorense]|uniref:Restriction endonuclease type IV Mrr domain-containing protein n=1 Tax=Mycobacterium montefiorense TaxID=154654 RepID=A0AA37PRG4_9MYCO|nr:restriction endonuclease [Mycobacterium montefiorense]GBG35815.1 hypothetical protein MmonteBS_01870 [Mycobacterium montefiorense]GKU35965.1 hypothetical protein NJB14191_33110 [Mycobacterium montefiorense]GKU41571.1 hypothetical protein NJB14192_35550 [Mycobacterium montefiorense]GKU44405.1 hypothetical protein NJB14194_10330 [Mycobacterium montefiorense]GKU51909.1 hypothetical protein NJB14195_31530 [Mycobacterium montefiorense]
MPTWKEYQEATATYYRALGLSAETDETIDGARGVHKIDVAVRGYRAGVRFLWIVECKYWNRRVDKSVVSTLRDIVQDVGADRGIILSRRGFQSGAPALATKSNITLTSLDELQTDTEDEYKEYRCVLVTKRCQAIIDEITALSTLFRRGGMYGTSFPAGLNGIEFTGRASILRSAAEAALAGKWPIRVVIVSEGKESTERPPNFDGLMDVVEHALAKLESEFATVTARLAQTRTDV